MTVIVNGQWPVQAETEAQEDASFLGGNILSQEYLYDFAVQGGAQSALVLTSLSGAAQQLPAKAVIMNTLIETLTTFTGTSSTASFGIGASAAQIMAATLISNGAFTGGNVTTGLVTPALPAKLTTASNVTITPGVSNLTAGKAVIRVWYMQGG